MKIFLDMDGVLVDFVGGACKAHNKPYPYNNPANLGIYDIEKLWGMPLKEFWLPLNSFEFWLNLSKTHEADDIVAMVTEKAGIGNIAILTSPSIFAPCVEAKRRWVLKYCPQLASNIIYTLPSAKQFIAGPNKLLIDDRESNVDEWRQEGGKAILVPRAWNKQYYVRDEVIKTIKVGLGEY